MSDKTPDAPSKAETKEDGATLAVGDVTVEFSAKVPSVTFTAKA